MSNTPKYILKKIRENRDKQLKELDLSNYQDIPDYQKLIQIPEQIFQLYHLEILRLKYHRLITIPDGISRLHNLKILDLGGNEITIIPNEIYRLQNLTKLGLGGNKLTILPDTICQLQNLTELGVGGNELITIPDVINQLKNLTKFNLTQNMLSTLPDTIGELQNLTQLILTFNQLTMLPDTINKLQNLTQLYLSKNKFTVVPRVISQLQNLTGLDLSDNNLTTVPIWISRLPKLKKLWLKGNPIKTPPLESLGLDREGRADIEKIRNYYLQIEREGKDYIYEAKLLIIGEPGAGKTTLAKKIENSDYELCKNEKSTEGIEVIRYEFPFENNKKFRINIWDFGGQEIYHATHQFFLTKRSLYALVADSRKEDTDFYYWLNAVELLTDNSPLLIVKNEKQDRQREIPERQLRGQFTNLKEILATNLATKRGLPEILKEIQHRISSLPHIGSALPKTWVRVREALENDERNHISIEQYLDICEKNGFTRLQDKLQLSGYLHDLGVCLHFQEDPLLKKTVILKPEWGTYAVYKVLDNKDVIRNFGRFTKSDLKTIWNEDRYFGMEDELLRLMLNFQLCYEIPDARDTYIAPQLLTENQPDYEWDETDNLILRYTYEFMPKGIITRFIVIMHRWIREQQYVWKSGVILKKDGTFAEVIEYYGKREIRIRISGSSRRDFMTIITHEFDKSHDSYNRLKYSRMIPCNCGECKSSQNPHFYAFETLRRFREKRQEAIQCQNSFEMVNVSGLMDDVFGRDRDYGKDEKVPDVIVNITNVKGNATESDIITGNRNVIKQHNQ